MSTTLLIVLGIIVVIALAIIGIYNSLIRLKNRVDEAWSDIDVQLKRRYDLIPNLIETVKGYASHERETLEKVVQARNAAMQAQSGGDAKKQAEAENMLSSTLKSIFALSESYPDLKANTNFLELQRELSDTENKIQASRRFYNGNVRDFNTKLQVFPTNIIADMLKFKAREFFEIEDKKEKENIKVKF
ncbi:LemA family protein [Patescibacteria group bacterium]|nr:LemA family protein [Patescibacteria group bacterium]MBU4601196.1 LemA family protein [Patescibacteria group bacterium]MCG2698239.1 LemA family protein [Candidatus Parcubacteria bacterium]